MRATTTRLRLTLADLWRIHERQIRDGAFGAAMVTTLLLIHSLLSPAPAPVSAPLVMREAARPAILIATATAAPPLPTATPWPTAEPIVIEIVAPTPPPEVIYVQAQPEIVYVEAPAPVVEAPPPPTFAPQQLVILDRQAWAEQAAGR